MPRLDTNRNLTLRDLVTRLTDYNVFGMADSIVIASDFQRGDEENGIWTIAQQRELVDSVQNNFPIGNITLVKEHKSAVSSAEPWMVLDGGNRSRTFRDYHNDKIDDKEGCKYSELCEREKARIDNIYIQIVWITIEHNDPPNIISEMFKRLNTGASPLSQGELIKAHGWKCNVPEIEMAKKLIGNEWVSIFPFPDTQNTQLCTLRTNWINTFGNLGETKRCDTLAMMCGYIVSAKKSDSAYFDRRYDKIHKGFTDPMNPDDEYAMSSEKFDQIIKKLNIFVNVMKSILQSSFPFGKITKGIISKSKIAPIWKVICEDIKKPSLLKIVNFYKKMSEDRDLHSIYNSILQGGGNNEMSTNKIDNVLSMIESWKPE